MCVSIQNLIVLERCKLRRELRLRKVSIELLSDSEPSISQSAAAAFFFSDTNKQRGGSSLPLIIHRYHHSSTQYYLSSPLPRISPSSNIFISSTVVALNLRFSTLFKLRSHIFISFLFQVSFLSSHLRFNLPPLIFGSILLNFRFKLASHLRINPSQFQIQTRFSSSYQLYEHIWNDRMLKRKRENQDSPVEFVRCVFGGGNSSLLSHCFLLILIYDLLLCVDDFSSNYERLLKVDAEY
ncbi:unnamed protein product [Vicia faba]|uniref:Uncharacterized protein n=1 Tax=Vicia faba TaxID=3906 RepID=A0AAV1A1N3_VICFA|nr:unnamed protein product [Vicia faba]